MGVMFWSIFALALLSPVIMAQEQSCAKKLDLVFVVDGSNSVHLDNFLLIKDSLVAYISSLPVSSGNMRAGVVIYSSGIEASISLTFNKDELLTGIPSFEYPDGGTATSEGLAWATAELIGKRRDGVPRVIVLLTDGSSDNEPKTMAVAKEAKDDGIQIFALGVGSRVNEEELNDLVAPHTERVFLLNDFRFVGDKLQNITVEVCKSATTTPTPTTTTTTPSPTTTTTTSPTTTTTTETTTTPGTTTSAHISSTTTVPTTANPCSGSRMLSDVGFNYDPSDCSRFVQCYHLPLLYDSYVAVYRQCPLGQFWNQDLLRCDEACNVNCPIDPCQSLPYFDSWAMKESCQGYWLCLGGRSSPRCCPEGHGYVKGQGCIQDCNCTESCGPRNDVSIGVCDKKPNWTDRRKYEMMTFPAGWVTMQCLHGFFNIESCRCE